MADEASWPLPQPLTEAELKQLEGYWFKEETAEWWARNLPPGERGSTYAIARLVLSLRTARSHSTHLETELWKAMNLITYHGPDQRAWIDHVQTLLGVPAAEGSDRV
jgi:hypothetical protein